jgi:hypothetical protein
MSDNIMQMAKSKGFVARCFSKSNIQVNVKLPGASRTCSGAGGKKGFISRCTNPAPADFGLPERAPR